MSQQKFKEEQFLNFGGINSKVSTYSTGQQEFLNLVNLDFSTPGDLTKRWGSTQYIGTGGPNGRVTGFFEYEKLNGNSRIVFAGSTLAYYVDGTSYTVFRSGITTTNFATSSSWIALGISNLYSFVPFVDYLFACNGKDHWKFDGSSSYFYGLPGLIPQGVGPLTQPVVGASIIGSGVATGMSGVFAYAFGYVNNRGFYGNPRVVESDPVLAVGNTAAITTVVQATTGASGVWLTTTDTNNPTVGGVTIFFEKGYGITGLAVYRALMPTLDTGGEKLRTNLANANFFYIGNFKPGGTFLDNNLGINTPMPLNMPFPAWDWSITSAGSMISMGQSLVPRYNEVYNNQYCIAGFSGLLSTLYFSDVGEPESIPPQNFVEVRTNDGDRITGLKNYLSQLVIFKERSMHKLTGDSPQNLLLSEISNQYGCLSHRAVCVYDNTMLFLDRKGICEYNGANVTVVSSAKIQPIFDLMNIDAARDNATALHFRDRNEIWFSIPYNGSSVNNLTIVYDYIVGAWTTFSGFAAGQLQYARGRLSKKTGMYADYSGLLYDFGASYTGDNGVGITTLLKTRFFQEQGRSVEKQFRRLFINVDPVTGTTSPLAVEFFQDFGTSVVLSRTMYQNPYQSRIDFGIPATALAIQISNYSAVDTMKLHGLVLEYRFQRMESVSS